MTGGIALILGDVGRNFAAGMSGGIAYIYKSKKFDKRNFNMEMIHKVEKKDVKTDMPKHLNLADEVILKTLIEKHSQYTNSNVAKKMLKNWDKELENFVKVMPIEYKRALTEMSSSKIKEVV